MTRHTVTVRHNFETAHRLPTLGGKCTNLHGHSWWVEVTFGRDVLLPPGVVTEFAEVKAQLRQWIDRNLDHGVMLGGEDPLASILADEGCKVFLFGGGEGWQGRTADLSWPTVENVALLLGRVAGDIAAGLDYPALRVDRVLVRETHVNEAGWTP